MAGSVKRPTLDLGSGHDLTVHEFVSCRGLCADGAEVLSLLSLPLLSLCSLSLSVFLKTNKLKRNKEVGRWLRGRLCRGAEEPEPAPSLSQSPQA